MGCFDAKSWLEVKTWKSIRPCPHCNCKISSSDMIIDGYVAEILENLPVNVNHVIVEPNGEWHTEDGKFGSAKWQGDIQCEGNQRKKSSPFTSAVDELLRNIASPIPTPPSASPYREVIDLTLDDSDEDTRPPRRGLPTVSTMKGVKPNRYPGITPPTGSFLAFMEMLRGGPASHAQPSMTPHRSEIDLTLDDSDKEDIKPPLRRVPTNVTSVPPQVPRLFQRKATDFASAMSQLEQRLAALLEE